MRLQCDKCDKKIEDPETAAAINGMKKHYATHKGAGPKDNSGTKKNEKKDS